MEWCWENHPFFCIEIIIIAVLFIGDKINNIIEGIRQERRKREIEKYRAFWRNL